MKNQNKLTKFFEWTKLKIRIHISNRIIYFKEREIWWSSLGLNIGYEEVKERIKSFL